MIKLIHQHIQDISLRSKLLLIVFFNTFIISIAALVGIHMAETSSNSLLYKTIAGSLSYSATEISGRLNDIQSMSGAILSNAIIQNDLSVIKDSDDFIARTNAFQSLSSLIPEYFQTYKHNNISYINLYNDSFVTYTNRPRSNESPDSIKEEILQKAMDAEGSPVWCNRYNDEHGLFLGRNVRRIRQTRLDSLGVLLICINIEEMIKEATLFSNQYENASYVMLDQGELVYHSKNFTKEQALQIQKDLPEAYQIVDVDNHSYFAVRGSIPNFDWNYICLVSYHAIAQKLFFSRLICLCLIILSVVFTVLLSRRMIASLIQHFDALIAKMKAFGKDESQILDVGYNYTERKDELGILHRQFDHMARKIQNLIRVNYINELLKKEAQLKALENQINPHFLYNTLESVNWRAKAIGESEISSMVESLGALLRITLDKKEDFFTLGQELELVHSYMTIQQIRFEDRLNWHIDVDDTLLSTPIPKLTIQPLVENSIHHALEEITETCYIQIIILQKNNSLSVYVKNNGSLFEEQLLEKLERNEIAPHGFGIGLLNINQRLKLTFGNDYGLIFYNEDDLAVAEIRIPFQP